MVFSNYFLLEKGGRYDEGFMGGFRNPDDVFREFFGGRDPFADLFGRYRSKLNWLTNKKIHMEQKKKKFDSKNMFNLHHFWINRFLSLKTGVLKGSYYALLQSLDFVLGVYYNMLSCFVVQKSHYFSHHLHYYVNSDPKNIEQEDHAEPLQARILQDILKW